jgi:hypothetical protein
MCRKALIHDDDEEKTHRMLSVQKASFDMLTPLDILLHRKSELAAGEKGAWL